MVVICKILIKNFVAVHGLKLEIGKYKLGRTGNEMGDVGAFIAL
jgi:hypothetical protein